MTFVFLNLSWYVNLLSGLFYYGVLFMAGLICKYCCKINHERIRARIKCCVMYWSDATLNNLPAQTSTMQLQACFGTCWVGEGKWGGWSSSYFDFVLFAEFSLL